MALSEEGSGASERRGPSRLALRMTTLNLQPGMATQTRVNTAQRYDSSFQFFAVSGIFSGVAGARIHRHSGPQLSQHQLNTIFAATLQPIDIELLTGSHPAVKLENGVAVSPGIQLAGGSCDNSDAEFVFSMWLHSSPSAKSKGAR